MGRVLINIAGLTLLTAGEEIYDPEALYVFHSFQLFVCLLVEGVSCLQNLGVYVQSDDLVKATSLSHFHI